MDKSQVKKFLRLLLISNVLWLVRCSSPTPLRQLSGNHLEKTHYLLTVHGLAGDKDTFGFLGPTLIEDLKSVDPTYNYEIITHSYYKESDNKDSRHFNALLFSKRLGEDLKNKFRNRPLKKGDKVSIIVHSQGGLVATIWFFNAFNKRNEWAQYHNIATHVDKVITLGTPFWGSKLAYAVSRDLDKDDELKRMSEARAKENSNTPPHPLLENLGFLLVKHNVLSPKKVMKALEMSQSELESLDFGGFISHDFRQNIIRLADENGIVQVPVPFYNVGAVVPNQEYIQAKKERGGYGATKAKLLKSLYEQFAGLPSHPHGGIGFGYDRHESDVAVLVPSSRLSFIALNDTEKKYEDGFTIGKSEFVDIKFQGPDGKTLPFHLVNSLHASPSPESIYDVAFLPRKCLPRIRRIYQKHAKSSPINLKNFVEELTNADILYFREKGIINKIINTRESQRVRNSKWQKKNLEMKYKVIDRLRTFFEQETKNLLNLFECDHSTYNIVFERTSGCDDAQKMSSNPNCKKVSNEIIKGRERYEPTNLEETMHGFTVDINIAIPQYFNQLDKKKPIDFFDEFRKYIKIENAPDGFEIGKSATGAIQLSNNFVDIYVDNPAEYFSRAGKLARHWNNKWYVRFFFTGYIVPKPGVNEQYRLAKKEGFTLPITVDIKGLRSKTFEAKIRPAFSTYISTVLTYD